MMIRRFLGVGVTLLVLAACGGSSDDTGSPVDADSTQTVDNGAAEQSSDAGSGGDGDTAEEILEDLDFGDGTARISIGDASYEFALGGTSTIGGTTYLGVCQSLFGMIAGGGHDVEGRDITIEFEIPPPDWESYDDGRFDTSPPRIEIEDNTGGSHWAADLVLAENFPEAAGASQIDDWTLDDDVARGRATFLPIESFGAPVDGAAPIVGEFEIGCGGDG